VRHQIHQNPELGYEETATSSIVAEELRRLGIEVRTGVARTGVVGILRGGKPGPVVAVRADMDALPVTEQTDLPFRSTKKQVYLGQDVGVAHACGHDVHTTALLGAAAALAAVRAELPGTVKFLFQPDEEGPPPGEVSGALKMVQAGVLDDPKPSAIFGIHSFPEMAEGVVGAVGTLGWTSGPTYAAVDQFRITLRGKQSHGAYPHLGIDPIVMASEAVLALQTIRSRTINTFDPAVVTVGIIRGGERFNIVPGEVHLEGTVRTYKPEVRELIKRRMDEILDGIARSAGGSYELDYQGSSPATINDPKLSAWARASLEHAVGKAYVIDSPPTMGGEDFSFYTEKVPGFYFRLGIVAPGTHSGGLHTPDFRADDTAIGVGSKALAYLVADYLQAPPR
jgi:amidohydrolase